jgi:hypothetical protein
VHDLLADDHAIVDALRRYGAAVEAAAVAGPTDVRPDQTVPSIGIAAPIDPRGRPMSQRSPLAPGSERRAGRRRPALVAASVVVVLVLVLAVAAAVALRAEDGTGPAVDTPVTSDPVPTRTNGTLPASEDVPSAPRFEDGTVLMWLPSVGQPQYLAQKADRPVSLDVGPADLAGCCDGIATINTMAGFIADGRLHTVDRVGLVVDTGVVGERVVADGSYGAFYVVNGSELVRYGVSLPAGVDGRWTIPDGWELPSHSSHSQVLDGRVILERSDRSRPDHEIAVWTPENGEIRTMGNARWVVDATMYPDGTPKIAWVTADCAADGVGCGVVITDLDTMEERAAGPRSGGLIGGGAFSHDGRLALFVGGQGQVADLAVLDLASMDLRVLPGTTVTVGESFGSATWTLDNRSVIYHGGGERTETRVIDVDTGAQRTLPWEVTYSMAALP